MNTINDQTLVRVTHFESKRIVGNATMRFSELQFDDAESAAECLAELDGCCVSIIPVCAGTYTRIQVVA